MREGISGSGDRASPCSSPTLSQMQTVFRRTKSPLSIPGCQPHRGAPVHQRHLGPMSRLGVRRNRVPSNPTPSPCDRGPRASTVTSCGETILTAQLSHFSIMLPQKRIAKFWEPMKSTKIRRVGAEVTAAKINSALAAMVTDAARAVPCQARRGGGRIDVWC